VEELTAHLASRVVRLRPQDLSGPARTVAKQMLMDWLGVAIAGRNEPLVDILIADSAEDGGNADCSLIGDDRKVSLPQAVLINGAMGHALDFDDVISGMGHPTVPVAPIVMAVSEKYGLSGSDVLLAFIAGIETECRISQFIGPSHYAKGWHSTGTFGTFGAAAAASKLLGLEQERLQHAFGIAGAQAAGLKSMFGTMTKPLHAGKAAMNGLTAARLAAKGFTANTEVLTTAQGFAATQSSSADPARGIADPETGFHVVNALFKYHAACYLTHSAIEAANEIRRKEKPKPEDIESIQVRVDPGHLTVCNIENPRTGLECKFSLRMTTAMALSGEDTFDDRLYSDATANRADLVALRDKVKVDPTSSANIGTVTIKTKSGREFSVTVDTGVPQRDLALQQEKLERKFLVLTTPVLGAKKAETLAGFLRDLEAQENLSKLLSFAKPH
jgi:2-methylcitrate dehydratase PrpD